MDLLVLLIEIISELNLPLLPSDLLMDLLQFHIQPNCTCSCLISHWTLQKPPPLFYTWMDLTSTTLLAYYLIGSHQHKYYCIRSPLDSVLTSTTAPCSPLQVNSIYKVLLVYPMAVTTDYSFRFFN